MSILLVGVAVAFIVAVAGFVGFDQGYRLGSDRVLRDWRRSIEEIDG